MIKSLLLAMLLSVHAPQEDPVVGTWLGRLNTGTIELRIVFHIERSSDGALSATLDSPDQGASGIAFDAAEVDDAGALKLGISRLMASYEGTLVGSDRLEGVWRQGGAELSLALDRVETVERPNRPQEPVQPYPYRTEDVVFDSDEEGVRLAGTLTLPEGTGPFPALVFISGSGPQDRDETVFEHKPFLVLADHLTRLGLATLRFDDRGVGSSTGTFATATSMDFVRDVEGALTFLDARSDIDAGRIGLLGHSEGGLVAPLVAQRRPIAFAVLVAPPGVPGRDILVSQAVALNRAMGAPEGVVEANKAVQERIVDLAAGPLGVEEKRSGLRDELRAVLGDRPEAINGQVEGLVSPWMQFFLVHDPAEVLSSLDIPVLAVLGSRDLQVVPGENVPKLEEALGERNEASAVRVLDGLNHLLQESETGLPTDYGKIEQTIAPQALELIGSWIGDQVGAGR